MAPTWPDGSAFRRAVEGSAALVHKDLQGFVVDRNAHQVPVQAGGDFAVVFFGAIGERRVVVRCPTRDVGVAAQRYPLLVEHLRRHAHLTAFPATSWLDKAIRIGDDSWPVVLMDEVAGGLTLRTYVENHVADPAQLRGLADRWLALAHAMDNAEIAHGDLQQANVMVDDCGALKLVDFDSVWVPAAKDLLPGEVGHRNFQHPRRAETGYWERHVDTFSSLVIYISLRAIAADPGLWKEYHKDENLVFQQEDFLHPDGTGLWARLQASPEPELRPLASKLSDLCRQPPDLPRTLAEVLKADPTPPRVGQRGDIHAPQHEWWHSEVKATAPPRSPTGTWNKPGQKVQPASPTGATPTPTTPITPTPTTPITPTVSTTGGWVSTPAATPKKPDVPAKRRLHPALAVALVAFFLFVLLLLIGLAQ